MNSELKLEAGKIYVFIDDAARDEFISNDTCNRGIFKDYYKDGFLIESVVSEFEAVICSANFAGIDKSEFHLFKEKESKPFDISEYEFGDKCLSMDSTGCLEIEYESWEGHQSGWCKTEMYKNISKQDVEAMAKFYKLI